jgi:hypothetical protein
MPPLPDPDLNPEELGQLLQKVRGYPWSCAVVPCGLLFNIIKLPIKP